jgi:hypothetical protein
LYGFAYDVDRVVQDASSVVELVDRPARPRLRHHLSHSLDLHPILLCLGSSNSSTTPAAQLKRVAPAQRRVAMWRHGVMTGDSWFAVLHTGINGTILVP